MKATIAPGSKKSLRPMCNRVIARKVGAKILRRSASACRLSESGQRRCGVDELKRTDPEIFKLIKDEERYEIDSIRLIPSENYVSKAVLEATGSILPNKYSEGYPGPRYYDGQRNIDQIETIVVARAKALFKADHANVQPHS